ncbi:uncharacterized protein LOC130962991 [Arachis stenosperma]|uniref:uncharacterized protein LOC130962991 n=1 Tax=Arachis stenosperma TaxID=217475 RepID=UPI0025ACC39D|nr:uncharacterized protein LOC130962991 [Arachis stenosperma]
MNSRPCGFGYDYDYFVGDGNLNDGSHYGIDEFSGREPYPYEQSPWQPSPSSYYDGNPSYNAYHSYEHDDSYHGYTSQPPPFYAPYSQPTPYFHQLPTYDPNLYSPYAYPCDDYEQATLESPPLQHLYLPTQSPMNDTLGVILQEQEELQTAFTSFTSTLQEFTSPSRSRALLPPNLHFHFCNSHNLPALPATTTARLPHLPSHPSSSPRHHFPHLRFPPSSSSYGRRCCSAGNRHWAANLLSRSSRPLPFTLSLTHSSPLTLSLCSLAEPPLRPSSPPPSTAVQASAYAALTRVPFSRSPSSQGLELPPLPESSGSDEETDLQTEGIPADEPAHMEAPPQTQESQPVPQPQPEPIGVPIPDPQD